jgi:2-keto-3-deoxy-L-rhamnonate aldolase RhmA
MAFRAEQKPALVRVASSSADQILNALDCGATGVVIPHVDSPEKALACATAARYGRVGRGYAGSTRSAGYGAASVAENISLNQLETTVIAQIEDLAALDHIEEISAQEGIDCLFIGMMDLTVALGAQAATDSVVIEAAEKICIAAQANNRKLGIFVPSIDSIEFWRDRGVTLFLMSSDHSFIKQGAKKLVEEARVNF